MNKENISTAFLLPAVEIKESIKEEFYSYGFINTYITSNKVGYPYEVLFLLFQPEEFNIEYKGFEHSLINNPNYIEIYDLGSNKVCYVFRIPEKFKSDYYLFLQGKYSQFSKEYKKLFPSKSFVYDSNHNAIKDKKGNYILEDSPFYKIFNRDSKFKARLAEKLGYDEDDYIMEEIDLYERQDENKELFEINIDI